MKNEIMLMEKSFFLNWYRDKATILLSQEERKAALSLIDILGENKEILTIKDNEAHISISGPMSQDGPDLWDLICGYGGVSYPAIIEAIDKAEETGIESIVFDMNTPGGGVMGLDVVYQRIQSLSVKTVAKTYGMIASAGMWIAAACDEIESTAPTAEFGSIGVVVTIIDQTAYLDEMGIKILRITSDGAELKAPDVNTEEGMQSIKDNLNKTAEVFYQRIAEGRGIPLERAKNPDFNKKGALLITSEALEVGMIDKAVGFSNNTPANAGKITEEMMETKTEKMSLFEFLAESPAAKKEVKDALEEAKEAGEQKVKAYHEMAAKFGPILTSAEYPSQVKELALKALTGESSRESAEAGIIAFDAAMAANGMKKAQEETEGIGETPSTGTAGEKSTDGQVRTKADLDALVNEMKEV